MTKKKKKYIKFYTKKISKLLAIFSAGSYVLSGFSYSPKIINNTIKCDIDSCIYDMDYLTKDMDLRNENNLGIEEMSNISTLKIDMQETNNLAFLSYYTNLDSIEISNAQLLTDSDINYINHSNIDEIYLLFDRDTCINNISEGFDLNRFKNKEYIKNINFIKKTDSNNKKIYYCDEANSIILFEYLKNYDGCNLDFMKYSKLNNDINNIIDSMDNENYDNNMDIFISIVNYICMHMEYDKEVLDDSFGFFKKNKINDLLDNYNANSLSSSITCSTISVVPGVCINYADALSTLCLKEGINVHTVTGKCEESEHAWNVVNFNGQYYLVDLTNFEKLNDTYDLIKKYRENPTKENYSGLISHLLIMINDKSLDYYSSALNILDYVEPKYKNKDNDNIYGTTDSKYYILLRNGLISLAIYFAFSIGMVSLEVIKQKRKYKKNKGSMKKTLDRISK